jgi:5-methylthioadenosine/S-adenosylhomocysteine deaminase
MTDRAARAWCTSYRAAWVLPVSGPPVRDGAVVVEGDRIAWVGPAGGEPPHLRGDVVELGDAVLGPALVNAHTHLDLTVLRGLLDGLPFFDWIRGVVAARDVLTSDETRDSARAGVIEGFLAGVATFADTAPTDAAFTAMREFGARGVAYFEAFGPDPAAAPAALAALRARVEASQAGQTPLLRVGVSPHAPYSVSDALYTAIAAYAREAGLPLATHVAESEAESALVRDAAGPFADFLRGRGIAAEPRAASPVELLARTGVLGADALLIHCVRLDPGDVARIATAGAAVATCPRSNQYFGHGTAPVGSLRAAGIRVGVGTDSMASNVAMDLLAEARDAGCGDLAGCWAAVSLGGARALGLDATIGTLERGKAADLAAFAAPGARESGALPAAVAPTALLLLVAGAERVRNGHLTADVSEISARAEAAALRLREWRARVVAR